MHGDRDRQPAFAGGRDGRRAESLGPLMQVYERIMARLAREKFAQEAIGSRVPDALARCGDLATDLPDFLPRELFNTDQGMEESFGNRTDRASEHDLDARPGQAAGTLDCDLGGAPVDRTEIADDDGAHENSLVVAPAHMQNRRRPS